MTTMALAYYIVLVFVAMFYNMIGIQALLLNIKGKPNRIYFVLSLLLSYWTVNVLFSRFSVDPKSASLWMRYSVIGWGTIYSVLFHLAKSLAEPGKRRSPFFYLFVYGVSIVNVVLFIISAHFPWGAFAQVKTSMGFIYKPIHPLFNAVQTGFLFYYVVIIVMTVVTMYNWHKDSLDTFLKRFVWGLYISILAVVLLGVFSDLILQKAFSVSLHLSLIWLVIPNVMLFYLMMGYSFIEDVFERGSDEFIDEYSKQRIFKIMGYLYVAFSYMLFYFFKINSVALILRVISAVYLYVVGILHLFLINIVKSMKYQYLTVLFCGIVTIFLITFCYMGIGGLTIWASLLIIVMISSVLNRPLYGYMVAAAMLISQALFWIFSPSGNQFYWDDYIYRCVVIISAAIVANFINRLYLHKIEDNVFQVKIQSTLTQLSTSFIGVNQQNFEHKINHLLDVCANDFGYDYVYLCDFSEDNKSFGIAYINALSDGKKEKFPPASTVYNIEDYQWAFDKFFNGESISITNIDALPKYARMVKSSVHDRNSKSMHSFPVMHDGVTRMVLVFESSKRQKKHVYVDYKQIIANLIGEAIAKIEFENKLFENANYDSVTKLINRHYFNEIVTELFAENTKGHSCGVIFLDIDNFKNINDSFGHALGDQVLVKVAQILQETSQQEFMISRFGGDEFVIACPSIEGKEDMVNTAESLLSAFTPPVSIDRYEFKLSLSMGIAIYPNDGTTVDELIKNADLAMYESKKSGRNRYHFCNDYAKARSLENVKYTNQLFKALANEELMLVYQPQMDMYSGKMIGAEALLRWNSPEFGLVSPGKFIPILEHTGLIIEVGEWVLKTAINAHQRLLKQLNKEFKMSINLSAVQFQDPRMIEKFANAFNQFNVDTHLIELEITETHAVGDPGQLISMLSQLKNLGCSVAIDDFGVRFSSLNRLQSLPIECLKIDKSFIDGIGIDRKKETIVEIIIELADSLGLRSIAEGVETVEQLNYLKQHGCEVLQGYYYAKPMPYDEFALFVAENS